MTSMGFFEQLDRLAEGCRKPWARAMLRSFDIEFGLFALDNARIGALAAR